MANPDKPWGTCGKCDRDFNLNKDGTLRHHLEEKAPGRQFSPMCRGAGTKPIFVPTHYRENA